MSFLQATQYAADITARKWVVTYYFNGVIYFPTSQGACLSPMLHRSIVIYTFWSQVITLLSYAWFHQHEVHGYPLLYSWLTNLFRSSNVTTFICYHWKMCTLHILNKYCAIQQLLLLEANHFEFLLSAFEGALSNCNWREGLDRSSERISI